MTSRRALDICIIFIYCMSPPYSGDLPSLENLRCFQEAARAPSFRAAAKVVALTPAALGQRIRQLENQLGVRLFARTTRSISLTAAGLALIPAARAALQAAAGCVLAARGETGRPTMDLTVGTRTELGLSLMLPGHDALTRACPGLRLNYFFGSAAELLSRLRSGQIDCAVTSMRFTDPAFGTLPLHREDYAFVGAATLLGRTPLAKSVHAASHTLLDVDSSLPLFRYWLDSAGRDLRFGRVWLVGAAAAMHRLVLEGRGVAVLPLYMVKGALRRGTLRTVFRSIKPHSDNFRLVFRNDDPRRWAYDALAKALLEQPLR